MLTLIRFLLPFWYIFAIVLLICIYRVFRPIIKGYIGEKIVAAYLAGLNREKYHVIHNIMLKAEEDTTQIDHVIVSNFGIFVIETKNYSGFIFGDEKDSTWTQVFYRRKEKFHNPIRQNYKHVMTLKNDLKDYPDIPYFPIVTFSSGSTLKVKSSTPVVYMHRLRREIVKHTQEVINSTTREAIAERLLSLNIDSRAIRKEHIETIQRKTATIVKEPGICPRCGGTLVHRTGKYGDFTGCSNYPNCKFISK